MLVLAVAVVPLAVSAHLIKALALLDVPLAAVVEEDAGAPASADGLAAAVDEDVPALPRTAVSD